MTEITRNTSTPGSRPLNTATYDPSLLAGRLGGKAGANGSGLVFKQATERWEFEEIYQLNYASFVEEVPQHPVNDDRLLVDQGDVVRQGQKIAEMGFGPERTARLHFEIRRNGTPVNPLPLLPD